MLGPYLVAIFAMAFSGLCALTLITTIRHFDPPDTSAPAAPVAPTVRERVAV